MKAFTLIELMILIAIVAILFAVSIPAFMTYVEKNKKGGATQVVPQGPTWDGMTCTEHTSVGGKGGTYTLCEDSRVWCYLATGYQETAMSCVRKSL